MLFHLNLNTYMSSFPPTSFWPYVPPKITSLLKIGILLFYSLISYLSFSLQKEWIVLNFAMKMHCYASKVSTKYNGKILCIKWRVLSHYKKEYLIIFKISAEIWMLIDEINVAKWFHVISPSLARCKEGDLPLLNFSNLTIWTPNV